MSQDSILARIVRALGQGDLLDGLSRRLPQSDLQSLLLHVFRQRSARRTPAELLAQYERSRMVQPALLDPRAHLEVERLAFACASGFEAIEPGPLAPLGLNVVLGQIDQNSCLATVRGSEVMADPTTYKALECARRRRAGETGTIKLCARSRQLRLQPTENPAHTPHFSLFSLVTAGRDRGALAFELESLLDHLRFYLHLLKRLGEAGHAIGPIEVMVSDTARDPDRLARAQTDVLDPLSREFPNVTLRIDLTREQGRNYYSGLCLRVDAATRAGQSFNLADGGFTDWTQRLLSNAKERLLVSGIGIELITRVFV